MIPASKIKVNVLFTLNASAKYVAVFSNVDMSLINETIIFLKNGIHVLHAKAIESNVVLTFNASAICLVPWSPR